MFDTTNDRFDSSLKINFQGENYSPSNREVFREAYPGAYDPIWFSQVKAGDKVKIKDDDGSFVTHEDGRDVFIAKTDAHLDELGFLNFEV